MKNIIILGGALSGMPSDMNNIALQLEKVFNTQLQHNNLQNEYQTKLMLINEKNNIDVSTLLDELIANPDTKVIVHTVAAYNGNKEPFQYIGKIRKNRKDIFAIGFNYTIDADTNMQYLSGLDLLKNNSLNLVVGNDTVNHRNMIIAPEETRYCETINNNEVLEFLVKMTLSRMKNTFTRSTVVEGNSVDWNSDTVPENLRQVVNHCINAGAYKPFLGKTAGHFAVKLNDTEILTSIRKTNFNELEKVGLVRVQSKGVDTVIAHGFRPSVGGQSQRIIFKEHSDVDCIVHFHCPIKPEFKNTLVPVKDQWPNECGSHDCGANTSAGLREISLGDGDILKVVYLDEHGPNIVFPRTVPAVKVINFINHHFDLSTKTGGLVS